MVSEIALVSEEVQSSARAVPIYRRLWALSGRLTWTADSALAVQPSRAGPAAVTQVIEDQRRSARRDGVSARAGFD